MIAHIDIHQSINIGNISIIYIKHAEECLIDIWVISPERLLSNRWPPCYERGPVADCGAGASRDQPSH